MKDGIIHIKKERSKPLKVYHIYMLYHTFLDFQSFDNEGPGIFHYASSNVSG